MTSLNKYNINAVDEEEEDTGEFDPVTFYAIFANGHLLGDVENYYLFFKTKEAAVDYIKTKVTPDSTLTYSVVKYKVTNDDYKESTNYVYKTMAVLVPAEVPLVGDSDTAADHGISYNL